MPDITCEPNYPENNENEQETPETPPAPKFERLSLRRKEKKFELGMVDGTFQIWTLKELTGPERDRYIDDMTKRMKMAPDGKSGAISTYVGVETNLLVKSLFGPDGQPVKQSFLQALPSSVQDALYNAAVELSALNPKAREQAKNA